MAKARDPVAARAERVYRRHTYDVPLDDLVAFGRRERARALREAASEVEAHAEAARVEWAARQGDPAGRRNILLDRWQRLRGARDAILALARRRA